MPCAAYGDPLLPLRMVSYRDARFALRLTVKVAADADAALVLPAIEALLKSAFGFAARSFGQGVSVDEVAAVAHGVSGVEAVQVVELHRSDAPTPPFVPRIFATAAGGLADRACRWPPNCWCWTKRR